MVEKPRRDIAGALVDFARVMGETPGTEAILQALGDHCAELLGVDGAGVLFLEEGGRLTVGTANTDLGRLVEEAEVELAEGPCSESAETGAQVFVADLEQARDRYPAFADRVLPAGVRAVHALPMFHRSGWVGALDLVSRTPGELDPSDLNTAQLLVEVAVAYLANSRAFEEQSRTAQQLQHALDSRVVIEQAKGRIAERHGIGIDEAFERLRDHSRHNRMKLRQVATDVINGDLDL